MPLMYQNETIDDGTAIVYLSKLNFDIESENERFGCDLVEPFMSCRHL